MRKTVITMALFLGLIVVVMTGCTSSKPFEKIDVITYARAYGILEQTSSANAGAAIDTFTGRSVPSSYYISKDKDEAKYLYDNYMNKNNWYPKADIEEIMVVVAREEIGVAVYDCNCYLMYFKLNIKQCSYLMMNGNMKEKNIMVVGVGGQGTLLTSRIIGKTALNAGYDVKLSEVHGMAQRGGSVVTFVRFGEKVSEPVVEEGNADILIAFERLEALRYAHFLKKDGVITR